MLTGSYDEAQTVFTRILAGNGDLDTVSLHALSVAIAPDEHLQRSNECGVAFRKRGET